MIELLRDRFDAVDKMLTRITVDLEEHSRLDRAYWKKLDDHEAQFRLLKRLLAIIGGGISLVVGWFIQHK